MPRILSALHRKTSPENVSLHLCYEMALPMPISWVKKSSLLCGLDVVQIHFQKVTDVSHAEYLTSAVGTQQAFNSEFPKEQARHEAHTHGAVQNSQTTPDFLKIFCSQAARVSRSWVTEFLDFTVWFYF